MARQCVHRVDGSYCAVRVGLPVLGTLLLLLEIHAPGTFHYVPATVLMFLGVLGIISPGRYYCFGGRR